jgi:uncharacterized protein with GYD domain
MSSYVLLGSYTDQGIKNIKEAPKRRAAARELAKKFGVDVKSAQLAMGAFDLIIHADAASDDDMAKFVLSLASGGNLRTTTVKVFSEADFDRIAAAVA